MFGIGTGEVLVILVIAMLVVGPERMVELAQQLGAIVAKFRAETDSVTREFREALSLEQGEGAAEAPGQSAVSDQSEAQIAATSPLGSSAQGQEEAGTGTVQPQLGPFVDREVEIASEAGEAAPIVLGDSEPVDIEVGEFVPRDEEAEPLELEQAVLVGDEKVGPDEESPVELLADDLPENEG